MFDSEIISLAFFNIVLFLLRLSSYKFCSDEDAPKAKL